MRWRDAQLWFAGMRFARLRARLQHDQAVEHGHIVNDVREGRRAVTHELADQVLQLDAVTDQLENHADEEEDETDPGPDPPRAGPDAQRP